MDTIFYHLANKGVGKIYDTNKKGSKYLYYKPNINQLKKWFNQENNDNIITNCIFKFP